MNDRRTLAELQVLWKKHLEDAEHELEKARSEVRKLKAEIQSGNVLTPDVHYAYQQALRVENLALIKLAKVLLIVNDLALRGKAPGEERAAHCG